MQIATAYRLKLQPNTAQRQHLSRCAGAVRWLWNHLLDLNIKRYDAEKKFIFAAEMMKLLPELKRQFVWLNDVPTHTLQRVCKHLAQALKESFKSTDKRKGFPQFKVKFRGDPRFYVTNDTLRLDEGALPVNKVVLPKIGAVRFRGGRLPEGKINSGTIRFDGKDWWIAIQCMVDREVEPIEPSAEDVIALDFGLKEAVLSNGERRQMQKNLRKALKQLAKAQRVCSRRVKGSKRRRKAADRVRALHRKVANCRSDFLHKTTREIVDMTSSVLVYEDLHVKGMAQNRKLSLSIADAGLGEMRRQLAYKLDWAGKTAIIADRWFPSTQKCSNCGAVKTGEARLTLSQRTYRCDCGHEMDRDLNAALNLRQYGVERLGPNAQSSVGQAMPEREGFAQRPSSHARGGPAGEVAASAVASHGLLKREQIGVSTSNVG